MLEGTTLYHYRTQRHVGTYCPTPPPPPPPCVTTSSNRLDFKITQRSWQHSRPCKHVHVRNTSCSRSPVVNVIKIAQWGDYITQK